MSRDETDDLILDVAARLLSRHGVRMTSMQAVADATGYSKAAIFAKFESKELLLQRTIDRCARLATHGLAAVADQPDGLDRDTAALETLLDLGLANPGFIALALASITSLDGTDIQRDLEPMGDALFAMFSITGTTTTALVRVVNVTAALSALAVLVLNYEKVADATTARPVILRAARAALHADTLLDA